MLKFPSHKVLLLLLVLPMLLAIFPQTIGAQQEDPCDSDFGCFEVGLPGDPDLQAKKPIDTFVSGGTPLIRFMRIIINFVTAAVVAIGIITVVVAGYIYMTARGDAGQVGLAKQFLSAALLGIFLALTSYLVLNTISPQFTDVKEPILPIRCDAENPCRQSGTSCVNGRCQAR